MKYVYLIQSIDSGLYKIGISNNPNKRLKQLQTGNGESLKLIHSFKSNYPNKLETALHNRYSHLKKINEWFNFDLSIEVNFINECEKIDEAINYLIKSGNEFI